MQTAHLVRFGKELNVAKPKFGYENFFTTGTVTVTSEATGFPKENAYDWNTYDYWKANAAGVVYLTVDYGSARPADFFGIAAHTLFDNAATIQCQYSTDNFSASIVDIGDLVTPVDSSPIFNVFTLTSARYWRLKITSTGAASAIGVASIGASLEMDRAVGSGAMLPKESRMDKIINQTSEGGQFIGRSIIRKGVKFSLSFTIQTLAFARDDWSTFIDHAEVKPFWYSWNPDYDDAVFCWMDGFPMPPKFDRPNTMTLGMQLMGLRS